jgi:polyphosphate kinase
MTRNLDRRVEAVAPVDDPEIREELEIVLDCYLADNRKSWEMRPDGSYVQRAPSEGESARSVHRLLAERASAGAATGDRSRLPDLDVESRFVDGE